ncbi:MAG: B12-binding domain-containing radical SAM protein, partial [Promethearchaeota archaeon]
MEFHKLKITLINPIFQKSVYSPLPRIIEKSRGKFPPLGLAYLAGILEKNNHKVYIIDQDVYQYSDRQMKQILKHQKPEIVGITCTSFTFHQARRVAKLVKSIFPEIKIVIGGPHVSIYPKEVLVNDCFDIGVMGDGEITIIEILKTIEQNLSLKNIQGIVYKENNVIKINDLRPPIKNLDELPFPAYHLLPINEYFDAMSKIQPFFTIITSRGCPFNCIFCLRSSGIHFGKKTRFRSTANIIKEIEILINKYKIREIFFYDDTFTINQKRIFELCQQIIKKKLK